MARKIAANIRALWQFPKRHNALSVDFDWQSLVRRVAPSLPDKQSPSKQIALDWCRCSRSLFRDEYAVRALKASARNRVAHYGLWLHRLIVRAFVEYIFPASQTVRSKDRHN